MSPRPLSPVQHVQHSLLTVNNISLDVKREDLIDKGISGNKYRKLKYNIEDILVRKSSGIVTFGGAFSNHIHAVATVGKKYNLATIGIIRGELDPNNPTLISAKENGMLLIPISRAAYRLKEESIVFREIKMAHPNYTYIPEGGTNEWALKGVAEIINEIETISKYDYIAVSAGTGGTAAGIYQSLPSTQRLLVFGSLRGDFLRNDILRLSGKKEEYLYFHDAYDFGGYAKTSTALIEFINSFSDVTGIPLDPIYNGKLVFGLFDLIQKDYFKRGSKILWIHTGGLQGIKGYNYLNKDKILIRED